MDMHQALQYEYISISAHIGHSVIYTEFVGGPGLVGFVERVSVDIELHAIWVWLRGKPFPVKTSVDRIKKCNTCGC